MNASKNNEPSDRAAYPWTREKVRQYIQSNTRKIELTGQYATRFIVWIMTRFVRLLSWGAAYRLGGWIGEILCRLKVRRDIAMVNLDIVYADTKTAGEKQAIYRKSLHNFGRQTINYLRIPLMDDKFWQENFALVNEQILRDAFNQGKGVILLYMHFGPWELPGGKICHAGYPLSVVAKKMKNKVIDKFVVDARSSMSLGTIKHRDAMNRILEGLKNGEGIIMVIDQNMKRSQSVFVQWMGRTASTVRSTAWMARETGAPVVTGYAVQSGPKEFALTMTEAIPWESHDDPAEELVINTQHHVNAVQKHIYAMPEQWFWLHRRWKIQPEGIPNPYLKKPSV